MICNMRLSNHPMRDAGRLPQRRSLRTRVAAAQHAPEAHRAEAPAPCLLPPVVNWHLTPRCNYRCKFCFATYRDWDHAESVRDRHDLMKVPRLLREAGASRISFVGGEPFLHPLIDELIAEAKAQGLATGAVTNGSCLSEERLRLLAPSLDWLAFSVDASSDDLHAKMGRGLPTEVTPHLPGGSAVTASASPAPVPANRHLARTRVLWEAARKLGFRLKLNTVVSRVNLHDDHGMADLALELRPERWKVFQVLPVEGQNDGSVEPLLITKAEFRGWVERQHGRVEAAGLSMVAETNEQMRSTYAMLDARCRFFANDPVTGGYIYGASLLEHGGVQAAWHSVSHHFDARQFGARGGLYQWGQSEAAWAEQQRQWLPSAEGRA